MHKAPSTTKRMAGMYISKMACRLYGAGCKIKRKRLIVWMFSVFTAIDVGSDGIPRYHSSGIDRRRVRHGIRKSVARDQAFALN